MTSPATSIRLPAPWPPNLSPGRPTALSPGLSRPADARRASIGSAGTGVGDGPVHTVLLDGFYVVRWLLARHGVLARAANDRGSALFRGAVARRLCAELAVHLQVTQELLHPRLRETAPDANVIEQAEVEQECLRGLLARLYRMAPDDPLFDARVTVLGEIFELHARHAVQQVFPLLQGPGMGPLAAAMRQRRDELLAQLDTTGGLSLENEEADPVGEPPR